MSEPDVYTIPFRTPPGVSVSPSLIGDRGPQGPAATVVVGSVTTGAPGSSVIVTNSGTNFAAVLNFVIPRGASGFAGNLVPRRHNFSADLNGVADTFTLPVTAGYVLMANGEDVILDGTTQMPVDDYAVVGNDVVLVFRPVAGRRLVIRWLETPA